PPPGTDGRLRPSSATAPGAGAHTPDPRPPANHGFRVGSNEYEIVLGDGEVTPLPWSNVIANPRFGCLVTESGLGSTWSENSRENRLTPWSNDPVADPPSEALYIRDEETGAFWTPTPLPVRGNERYRVRHGQGYTFYEYEGHGVAHTLRVSVAPEEPVKLLKLTLKNTGAAPRRLSATYYAEWVLGVTREGHAPYVITEADLEHGAILARNPYNFEFAERVAFAATDASKYAFTADRTEFLGRNGSPQKPRAMLRRTLSGRNGAGFDPCAALQVPVDLKPGEERSLLFLLGEGDTREGARQLSGKYRELPAAEEAHEAAVAMWDRLLSAVQVDTPDGTMDVMLNRWLLYQSLTCRIWGRTAFYQSGGAYGFRDQLQDVMAWVHAAPELAREQILRCAERQFKEGDVQHWWHTPTGRGVRTRFSDDLLWLPFVTAYYVQVTGDTGVLDEERPFLEAPLLQPGQEDLYLTPTFSDETGTLYEHCLRAIERGSTEGPHGLPLMGAGDWNDGMNRVGIEGRGESVWVGWFLYATLASFLPLCEQREDKEQVKAQVKALRDRMKRLKQALEAHAWDGDWYRRAYYDSGPPLGSRESDECKIDSIAQSWAVISGAARPARAERAMQSVGERLAREDEGLLLLFTPPFDNTPLDPGYIKGYLPGIRENGGQYTHAAIWTVIAHALMGHGDEAYRLFSMLNPISHVQTPEDLARYKAEPYVVAADIYSHPQHIGRGGWTWYTGSASWLYRAGVEYILGLKRRGKYLTVEPCIPSHWPGYRITYRFGTSTYNIQVERSGTPAREPGAVELDGQPVPRGRIRLTGDGKAHEVRVVLAGSDPKGEDSSLKESPQPAGLRTIIDAAPGDQEREP
ncbi:MAG: GH36-type glycosyl hydrolase domain-containing protein, partial [Chloroflexia bacterium]